MLLFAGAARAQIEVARDLYTQGRHTEALRVLRAMPQTADVRYSSGVVLYAAGQTEDAIRVLTLAREQHPEARLFLMEILAYLSPTERQAVRHVIPADLLVGNRSGVYAPAPKGTVIDVGVLMRIPDRSSPEYAVVQSIYNGVLVSVDAYNEQTANMKIRLHFEDAGTQADQAFRNLVLNDRVKAVIGPLRSDEASLLAASSLETGVPVLLPLANASTLPAEHPFLFRFNPTADDAGRAMARTAYQRLGLRRIGVFIQAGTEGQREAMAFKNEFTLLGGYVTYHESNRFTEYGTVSAFLDTLLQRNTATGDVLTHDGVYIPFSQDGTNAILEHFMTGLEARQWRVTVLGNEMLGMMDHSAERLARLPIYHTSLVDVMPKYDRLEQFRARYVARTQLNPNEFAYLGYDVATYLLQTLQLVQNPAYLPVALTQMETFHGLGGQFRFNGSAVNRWVPVFKLTPDAPVDVNAASSN
jgi:ABC-type branched-subunit amino acid transport system substrate-binding protein